MKPHTTRQCSGCGEQAENGLANSVRLRVAPGRISGKRKTRGRQSADRTCPLCPRTNREFDVRAHRVWSASPDRHRKQSIVLVLR